VQTSPSTGGEAVVKGGRPLSGAKVLALRTCGQCLPGAGRARLLRGKPSSTAVYHLDRGYDHIGSTCRAGSRHRTPVMISH